MTLVPSNASSSDSDACLVLLFVQDDAETGLKGQSDAGAAEDSDAIPAVKGEGEGEGQGQEEWQRGGRWLGQHL